VVAREDLLIGLYHFKRSRFCAKSTRHFNVRTLLGICTRWELDTLTSEICWGLALGACTGRFILVGIQLVLYHFKRARVCARNTRHFNIRNIDANLLIGDWHREDLYLLVLWQKDARLGSTIEAWGLIVQD